MGSVNDKDYLLRQTETSNEILKQFLAKESLDRLFHIDDKAACEDRKAQKEVVKSTGQKKSEQTE